MRRITIATVSTVCLLTFAACADAGLAPESALLDNTVTASRAPAPTNQSIADIAAISDVDPEVVLAVLQYDVTTGRRAANSVVPRNGVRSIETLLGETFGVRTSEPSSMAWRHSE